MILTDRLKGAIRSIVEQVLAERDGIDFRGLYAAKVVSQDGQTVTVTFEDERLRSKAAVAITPTTPGQSVTLSAGTRVLVGWIDGDPSEPYMTGAWLGDGGLVGIDETFSGTRRFIGPLTECKASSSATATQVALKGDTVSPSTPFGVWAAAVNEGLSTLSMGGITLTPPSTVGTITGPCATNLKAT